MDLKIIFFSLFLLFTINLSAQNHILSSEYRLGIPTSSLKTVDAENAASSEHRRIKSLYDNGKILTYNYLLHEKFNLSLSAGFELARTKHVKPFVDSVNGRFQSNIIVKSERYSYRLGINKSFNLYSDNAIVNLGIDFVKRNSFYDTKTYSQGFTRGRDDWLEYKYSFEAFYDGLYPPGFPYYDNRSPFNPNHWSAEFLISLELNIYKGLYFKLGFSYARDYRLYYDYTYKVRYYEDNSTVPYLWFSSPIHADTKKSLISNFFYINTGLTYRFKTPKK